MNNFAPILIPTLNRHVHFKRCVESLATCTHADKTDLFIAFDYPLNESHREGYEIIKAYLPNIKGFKTVNIIERLKNYGARNNIVNARKTIFEKYDRMILSEDDNEFSPNFLDYINKGLDKFENDPRIYAICGYNYPIEMPQDYSSNYYFGRAFSAWGYGIWKNRHEEFMRNFMHYDAVVQRLNNTREALMNSVSTNAFLLIVRQGYMLGDYAITAGLTLKNMYCVFPVLTKVRNHGHDGSGVNCGIIKGENKYLSQKLDNDELFVFSTSPNSMGTKSINKLLRIYKKRNFMFVFKCYTIIRYILYRITGKSFVLSDVKKSYLLSNVNNVKELYL